MLSGMPEPRALALTGEIRILQSGGDGIWQEVNASVDCSGWTSRYAETVTVEVDRENVALGEISYWLVVGTGKARWGEGPCSSSSNECAVMTPPASIVLFVSRQHGCVGPA